MWLLRYFLLLASVGALALVAYAFAHLRRYPPPPSDEPVILIGIGILLILNLIYVFKCPPFGIRQKSRLLKLGSLWLDAKERELRERADKPPQSN
jgi:O-antigen/teichoic acid export membrane protein